MGTERWAVSWVDRIDGRLKESRYATEDEARQRAAELAKAAYAFDVRVTDMHAR
jgi:hypothetical protein